MTDTAPSVGSRNHKISSDCWCGPTEAHVTTPFRIHRNHLPECRAHLRCSKASGHRGEHKFILDAAASESEAT